MTRKMWQFDENDLASTLNDGAQSFIKSMVKEGIITEEQQEKMKDYFLIVVSKGFFGKIYDKFFDKGEESLMKTVKKIN